MYIVITGAMLQRIKSGDKMINKLKKNGYDKNIVCVRTLCMKDGNFLDSNEWDKFFDYRVDDIKNYVEEVVAFLEWKEKELNDTRVGKFEIILLDIYKKSGV